MSDRAIKIVKDSVISGYTHAGVVIRPWVVYVGDKRLVDKSGRPRRFSTEAAAMAAARRFTS